MSAYSMVNLKELPDVGEEGGMSPAFEGRFARKHMDSQELGVSFFRYGPGMRAPVGHHHREQEEAYVVLAGSGRLRLDDEIVDVKRWDVIRVAPETTRAFEGGPDGIEVLAIGGSKPPEGDGVTVEGFWPAD